jgi:glycerophosphoryl diester phosphodiesterase
MRVLLPLLILFLACAAFAEGPLLIAHRGVVTEESPENSLAALERAIEAGYTHVEVDLRPTKDGTAICLHDRSLRRTFESAMRRRTS